LHGIALSNNTLDLPHGIVERRRRKQLDVFEVAKNKIPAVFSLGFTLEGNHGPLESHRLIFPRVNLAIYALIRVSGRTKATN